jgi:hypothetical protein
MLCSPRLLPCCKEVRIVIKAARHHPSHPIRSSLTRQEEEEAVVPNKKQKTVEMQDFHVAAFG